MPYEREMDADLMWSSRLNLHLLKQANRKINKDVTINIIQIFAKHNSFYYRILMLAFYSYTQSIYISSFLHLKGVLLKTVINLMSGCL